jgi:predicted DNA repair protein MutK
MSGLLSLLDDVAALARLAAVHIDDVASQTSRAGVKIAGSVMDDAAKAGTKSLGVVIDDAAVTPKYVQNLPAARELPMVWKIARGSVFNKIVILLPAAMLLSAFAPWLLTPLLMLGGAYLCFEGAEKILHLVRPEVHHGPVPKTLDAAHLEAERVAGAIKTDFILSAEIMTIALAQMTSDSLWVTGSALALVGLGITALVYGSVAILVKADDVGLRMAQIGRWVVTRSLGVGIVKAMPLVLSGISAIGTAAMLWVGGSIVIHGLEVVGWGAISNNIHNLAAASARMVGGAGAVVEWAVTAGLDGLFGLALGLMTIPLVRYLISPVVTMLSGTDR